MTDETRLLAELQHPRWAGGRVESWRLAEAVSMTAPRVQGALRQLERAGLVERGRGWVRAVGL